MPYREVFGLVGRYAFYGTASRLFGGGKAFGSNALHECRFISPHQSLTRQLPPEGKPSLRCANMANMALHCGLPLRSALIGRLRDKLLAVFFLPKGKPSLHCANTANVAYMADMSNISLNCGLPLRSALIRRLRRQTACSFLPPRRGRLPLVLQII